MSEGTHSSTTTDTQPLWKNKTAIGVAGAVAAIVVTGVLIQVLTARSGSAGPAPETTGKPRPTAGQRRDSGIYVARVGKQLISQDALAEDCVAKYGREVLENIVNRTIIQQACAEQGITVSDAEVGHEITRIAKRFKLPVDTWLKMLQDERGLTPAQYQRDVIWPMLALKKLARADVSVTEEDVQKAFVRDYGPRVKAKMIMFDNLRHAQKIWGHIAKNPDDFERMAREHSIEPNSRSIGGAIPPIRKHAGNEALEDEAFKLEDGEISGVIQVGYNRYVILLCEGRTEPLVTDIETVRAELAELIRDEKVQAAVARKFAELKRKTRVDNYLTNTSTGGEVDAEIEQTSGTEESDSGVTNAAGAKPAGEQQYPPSPTRTRSRRRAPAGTGPVPKPGGSR